MIAIVRSILITTLFTLFTLFTSGQDSSRLRISLLTCTPGDELYSIFGHSGMRVIDSNSVTDVVYNYGTFNFDDEGFYMKFIRGKLLYYGSIEQFDHFRYLYQATGRGMTEQELNLTGEEKIRLRQALNDNMKGENRYYLYDFFLDNCTTRLRDLIVKGKSPAPVLPAVMDPNMTFRDAIDIYLINGKQYWSKLGIDILLGARTDKIMSTSEQQFLPDNLMYALDSSKNIQMVKSKAPVYQLAPQGEKKVWFTPMFFFSALLLLYVILSFSKNTRLQIALAGLDGLLFFLTGALGILLIFMMTATDHSMTRENYNILWAWPTHIIVSFFITRPALWMRYYFVLTAIAMVLMLAAWFFLPQRMSPALIPLIVLIIFRSVARSKTSRK